MKNNLVIVPGLFNDWHKKSFQKMITFFKKNYNVYYFNANYNQKNDKVLKDFKKFLQDNNINKSYFVTHSYGVILLKLLLKDQPNIDQRVVEIAPLNNGSKVLNRLYVFAPLFFDKFVLAVKEFINNENKFLKLPEPNFFGVIAGSKIFRWQSPEYYVIRLFFPKIDFSDGKVFVSETKSNKMRDFAVVKDDHTGLVENDKVFKKIDKFFKTGEFN